MKDKIKRGWKQLIMAVPLVLVGGLIGFMAQAAANPFLIVIGFAMMAAGALLFKNWWQLSEVVLDKKTGKEESAPNSFNIYRDRVEFSYIEKPLGWPHKFHNDSKYYYQHIEDGGQEKLKAHALPDVENVDDPKEFANPVRMPCNEKYFTWYKPGLQKLSTITLGVVIGLEVIGLIALGG